MNKVRLGNISEVFLSNVDKKSVDGQIKVRLCNFTDVYNNWAITQEMYNNFMQATATKSQIEKLSISKGMVAITKDSETKYDIGVSAYIADHFDDVVLGYHCVLIKPNHKLLSGKYLNVIFHSSYSQKYFENHASGSGQRYTLSKELIEDMGIPYVALENQNKIGDIFSKIDRKIEINKQINDNLEQQVKTIFSFRFLQNAKTEWKQQSLAELAEMYQPKTISGKDLIVDGKYFVYGANGVIGKYNQYNHTDSEIAIACRGASCGSIQMTLPLSWITGNAMVIRPYSDFPYREYLYYYLLAKNPNYLCSGSAQPQLTRENLTLYTLKVPSKTELDAFEKYAKQARKIIIKNQQEIVELLTLREWLLPMLVNGQATISD